MEVQRRGPDQPGRRRQRGPMYLYTSTYKHMYLLYIQATLEQQRRKRKGPIGRAIGRELWGKHESHTGDGRQLKSKFCDQQRMRLERLKGHCLACEFSTLERSQSSQKRPACLTGMCGCISVHTESAVCRCMPGEACECVACSVQLAACR